MASVSFSDVMEERLKFYIKLNQESLKAIDESDESEDVKSQLSRIYNAKIDALKILYDEFY